MNSLLESEYIMIRRTSLQDIEYVTSEESKAENKAFIIPWEKAKHEASLQNEDILHLLIEDKDYQPVGYMILAGLQNPNHSIELLRITISKKEKGYGRQAVTLIQQLAFQHLKAHRLWLDVKTTNARAKHLYESVGFTLEGTLRDCLKSGDAYESLHIMSMLKSEYERV
ncbi:GNAT family N-acetyltransferase [Fredinandcohnia humi]